MRTILRSRFHATFFLPRHGFGMILNKNKSLKPIFCANLRQGEAAHFIKRGGLLSSLALFFNLKKRTMKGRWVKYLLWARLWQCLPPALPNQPIADTI